MCQELLREFETIDLSDKRLDRRAVNLLETLWANPSASINSACDGWSESLAAYRFFSNDRVKPEQILVPHREATEDRIAQEDVALIVQDTTELDFSKHPPKDAGLLNSEKRFGFYDHTHAAFTPEGLCLGVLDVEFFNRTADTLGKAQERKSQPIEEKETFRWLEGYRLACELAGKHPQTQIISVADAEADIYDIFLEVSRQPTPADFVIRAKQDRSSLERDPEAGAHAYKKVRDEVAQSDVCLDRKLELPRTPKREPRLACLEIRAKTVTVKPPHARSHLDSVTYNLVLVEEIGRPADDETAICWLLITNLPIDTPDKILRVIDTYGGRWPIEPFFRTFKTGCAVEEIQLETEQRLLRCLMFYKVIAWRIIYLTFLGRECPDLNCDVIFADEEWKSVWKIVTKESPPETAPAICEFLPLLARLGGYNGRKNDPPPGPQAIWTGVRRMMDFALAWKTFGPGKHEKL